VGKEAVYNVRATLALAPAERLSTVQVSPLGDQLGYEDSIPLSLPKQPTVINKILLTV